MPIRILMAVLCTGLLAAAPAVQAQSLSSLFKRVKSSVVVVKVTDDHRKCSSEPPGEYDGLGSGVVIDAKGRILTAAHVVQDAKAIVVEFSDGEEIAARVEASSPGADVALLDLAGPPKNPVAASLGDSDGVEVGDRVFVVGAPLGINYTLTAGFVSGVREDDTIVHGLETARYLQTDAAINPGNSGGPMFNESGEVVGIVSYIISASGGHEGLGFAVAANTARKLLLQERSLLTGLEGLMLDADLAGALNVPQPTGLLVQRVTPRSPAAALGLRPGTLEAEIDGEEMLLGGDVILSFDGTPLSPENLPQLRARLHALRPGQTAAVSVLRSGRIATLSAPAP